MNVGEAIVTNEQGSSSRDGYRIDRILRFRAVEVEQQMLLLARVQQLVAIIT